MLQLDLLGKEAASAAAKIDTEIDHDLEKADGAFRTISEVSELLDVPQHVLRFWESRFSQIKPLKLKGGRRYYRPADVDILTTIKHLLYKQGYTIKGAKKAFAKKLQPLTKSPPAPVKTPSAGEAAALERKKNQLAVLRQELAGLRDIIAPYVKA